VTGSDISESLIAATVTFRSSPVASSVPTTAIGVFSGKVCWKNSVPPPNAAGRTTRRITSVPSRCLLWKSSFLRSVGRSIVSQSIGTAVRRRIVSARRNAIAG
jgi:hypothetical protein